MKLCTGLISKSYKQEGVGDELLEVLILKYNLTMEELLDEIQDFILTLLLDELLEGIFQQRLEQVQTDDELDFMHKDEEKALEEEQMLILETE